MNRFGLSRVLLFSLITLIAVKNAFSSASNPVITKDVQVMDMKGSKPIQKRSNQTDGSKKGCKTKWRANGMDTPQGNAAGYSGRIRKYYFDKNTNLEDQRAPPDDSSPPPRTKKPR